MKKAGATVEARSMRFQGSWLVPSGLKQNTFSCSPIGVSAATATAPRLAAAKYLHSPRLQPGLQ